MASSNPLEQYHQRGTRMMQDCSSTWFSNGNIRAMSPRHPLFPWFHPRAGACRPRHPCGPQCPDMSGGQGGNRTVPPHRACGRSDGARPPCRPEAGGSAWSCRHARGSPRRNRRGCRRPCRLRAASRLTALFAPMAPRCPRNHQASRAGARLPHLRTASMSHEHGPSCPAAAAGSGLWQGTNSPHSAHCRN